MLYYDGMTDTPTRPGPNRKKGLRIASIQTFLFALLARLSPIYSRLLRHTEEAATDSGVLDRCFLSLYFMLHFMRGIAQSRCSKPGKRWNKGKQGIASNTEGHYRDESKRSTSM